MGGKSVAILESLRGAIRDTLEFRRINGERCYRGIPGSLTSKSATVAGHHSLAILRQLLLQSGGAPRERASEYVGWSVSAASQGARTVGEDH